jgi:glutathione peroxidase-family protein
MNKYGRLTPHTSRIVLYVHSIVVPNIHVMQKVEINGHYTHPVYRFLKRHSPALYNAELCQGRNIPSDFCAFLVNRSGMPVKFL